MEEPTSPTDGRAGFDDFVRARWKSAIRLAYAMTLDHAAAEDLAQDAFAKLWFRWPKLRGGIPEAYLRRVLVTTFISGRRRKWRLERPSERVPDSTTPGETHRVDTWDALRRGLAGLSPRQRAVVFLRYAEDLPEREVAELLGCSVGSVKQYASRGLRALRAAPGLALFAPMSSSGSRE